MRSQKTYHVLLILTGGTICSFANENGERVSDVEQAETLIVRHFRESNSPVCGEEAVCFACRRPLNILSENMTVAHWNALVEDLKSCDFSQYDGVIVLHGTDTLAYTACLLALLLAGTPIPVFFVSSQLPIYLPEANGNHNFRTAVELIADGVEPDVYAVYRNDDGVTYLHRAAHLLPCANHSENFYSADMTAVDGHQKTLGDIPCKERKMPLQSVGRLSDCVLRITPYVGIKYDRFSLSGVRAVLHGTYHSSTAEVEGLLTLKARCDGEEKPIPLFLEPCHKDAYAYETTGELLRSGIRPVWGMTSEMVYVKLLVGCAMGLDGDALECYLHTEINGEMIRQ